MSENDEEPTADIPPPSKKKPALNKEQQRSTTVVQVCDAAEESDVVEQPQLSNFQMLPVQEQSEQQNGENQKPDSSYGSQASSQQAAVDESAILQVLQSPQKPIDKSQRIQVVASVTNEAPEQKSQSQPVYEQYAKQAQAPSLPKHLPPFEPVPTMQQTRALPIQQNSVPPYKLPRQQQSNSYYNKSNQNNYSN